MVTLNDLLTSGATSHRVSLTPELREGEWNSLFETDGAGMIAHLWFTFPPQDVMLGRRNLLRVFWDHEEEPSIEAPLGDFFGVPFGLTGSGCNFSSRYIAVAPHNGLNCYFPMPFARHARMEILPQQLESGGGFYFQADYYRFRAHLPDAFRELRFHAQFRFENPCENYGRNYLFLDATGRGALVGATFGIEANEPQLDSWYHGGGDTIFLDGETDPHALHGIGAEDFFGHSWGVREFHSPALGTPLLEIAPAPPPPDRGEAGPEPNEARQRPRFKRVSLYRFFVDDPVVFHSSARGVLGAMANNHSSVAYWYQTEPHRPFFRTPPAEERMPHSEAPYGSYDVEPADPLEWMLLAPFRVDEESPFDMERPLELRERGDEEFTYTAEGDATRPGGEQVPVKWVPARSYHNFVDFHTIARPALRYIRLQTNVLGYALRYIESERKQDVLIHLGFDDDAAVRVNDRLVFYGQHADGFREEAFKARLKKGRNRILIKLSNHPNTTWRLWSFSFRAEQAGR